MLHCLLAGLCSVAPLAALAQDEQPTGGTAPGPGQRSVTETGDIPAELEPAPAAPEGTPGTHAPGVKAGGKGLQWGRAPIRYYGEVDLLFTDTIPSGRSSTYDTSLYTRVNGTSYLKAPWFASVEGGLGLVTSLEKSSNSHSDSVSLTGDAGITLFPISRFPFHAFASVTNNRVNQDLIGTSKYTSTSIGISQNYTPPSGRVNMTGSALYNKLDGDRFGVDKQVSVAASLIAGLEQQQITVLGTAVQDERQSHQSLPSLSDRRERSSIYNLSAKDEYHDGDTLTLISLASANRSTFHISGSESDSSFLQAISTGSWLPIDDVPLQVNGGVHVSTSEMKTVNTAITTKSDTETFGGNVGATYRWNRNFRLSGTGSASLTRVRNTESKTTRLGTTASYSSDSTPFHDYFYNYGLAGSATLGSNHFSNNANSQSGQVNGRYSQTTEAASHSLSKIENLDNASVLTKRFTQGISASQQSGQHSHTIQHSAGIAWTQTTETYQLFASATLSDQRAANLVVDMLNTQLSAMGDVGHYSTLSGGLTFQLSRQKLTGSLPTGDSQSSTSRHASAEATYVNARAFGVVKLKFTSMLRADTSSRDDRFTGTTGAPAEDIRMMWENRFDYTVGLLTLQLLGRVTQSSGRTDGFIFASAQRRFGGFL